MARRASKTSIWRRIRVVSLRDHILFNRRKSEAEQQFPVHRGKQESRSIREHLAVGGEIPPTDVFVKIARICDDLQRITWEGKAEIYVHPSGQPIINVDIRLFDDDVRLSVEDQFDQLISLVGRLRSVGVVYYHLNLYQNLLPIPRRRPARR